MGESSYRRSLGDKNCCCDEDELSFWDAEDCCDVRRWGGESTREAHETRGSPRNTGPVILRRKKLLVNLYNGHNDNEDILGISVELSAFIHTKDQIDLLACPVSLVENTLVVPLGCPQPLFNAQIQIEL